MVMRTAVTAVSTAILSVLLAACGGSGGSAGSAAPAAAPAAAPVAPLAAAPILTAAAVTGADAIEIENYSVVGSTRISRTVFEYTYRAEASNWGEADATVNATLASTAASTVVVDGALGFGDIAVGATVESADTFTIRQDRSQPFSDKALVWTVQATALPATTFELIEQALANSVIDAETALVYKVFAEFNDSRLPAEYVGRNGGHFEATALGEAEERFDTLSPATQQIIAPFLVRPDVSGVALDPAPAAASALRSGPTAAAAASSSVTWSGKWVIPNEVAIFWDDSAPLGAHFEQVADAFAADTKNVIWPRLSALFGPPTARGGYIRIFVESDAAATSWATSNLCTTNPEVHMAPQHQPLNYVLAHELAHAYLYFRFPALVGGCNQDSEYKWMHEATAKWAEHYVYPTSIGNKEHEAAPRFLNDPTRQLEYFGDNRQYGAYLWFLFITKGKTSPAEAQRVVKTWEAIATTSSLAAVNSGVYDLGGLKEQWPEFVLFNWNRMADRNEPYRDYWLWDQLRHKARESTTAVQPSGYQAPKRITLDGTIYKGFPLGHRINHLGAQYWHFDFSLDDRIRRVRLIHPYANGSEPNARVQVIVKRRDKDWEPAEDWTGYERRTLCRDKTDEDFEEMVVVISDSEFIDRSHVLDDGGTNPANVHTFMEVSALGCSNWIGTVDFSPSISGSSEQLAETGKATNVTLEIEIDRFNFQLFKLTGGVVNWTHSGSFTNSEGDFCSGASQGTYSLQGSVNDFYRWIAGFQGSSFSDPLLEPIYHLRGFSPTAPPPSDYECRDAENNIYLTGPIYGSYDLWVDTDGGIFPTAGSLGLYDYDPTGITLAGSSILRDRTPTDLGGTRTRTYTWLFNKNGTFNGEPEP